MHIPKELHNLMIFITSSLDYHSGTAVQQNNAHVLLQGWMTIKHLLQGWMTIKHLLQGWMTIKHLLQGWMTIKHLLQGWMTIKHLLQGWMTIKHLLQGWMTIKHLTLKKGIPACPDYCITCQHLKGSQQHTHKLHSDSGTIV